MATPAPLRVTEGFAWGYRRTWRGSVIASFVNPVLYLTAMGLGLGTLVDQGAGAANIEGFSYLEFLAPGLLAAAAMQTAVNDSSWPVLAGHKWRETFYATLATPIRIPDLLGGHLTWVAIRLVFTSVVFVVIMAAFGAAPLLLGLVAVAPAVLTGMAFAAPVSGYAAWLDDAQGLVGMVRFGIVPMFLFSGTFFPITQLPAWLQPIAYATPLWHGVALCRAVTLQLQPPLPALVHVAYLLAWVLVGAGAALYFFRRRLLQ